MKELKPFAICVILFICVSSLFSQGFEPPSSTALSRLEAYEIREEMKKSSLINNIPFTNIGPTIMSGRVVDIEVNPKDPSIFYVAYASGGLWKTVNNGTTFTPIFDNEAVMTLGDIDVNWESGRIVVGTGEVNSSRSSYAGLGIYVSDDDGKTWEQKGLSDSHHIGKVLIDQDNPNEIIVAALGHLYSKNAERGVFKTKDGGKTWERTLFINENTGVVDLIRDPQEPNVVYAAAWERIRKAWDFQESGNGSGIYKSNDRGSSWELITTGKNGFPMGEGTGRIGLTMYHKDGQSRIYALLDNYNRRPKEVTEEEGLTKDELREISSEDFLKLDDQLIGDYLRSNRFDRKYSVKKVKSMVKAGKIEPNSLVEYTEDANSLLFDTPVIGAEVYASDDGGKTWKKTNEDNIDFLYNSYGYYFGLIRVDPVEMNNVYIAGVPILKSEDGGKNWNYIGGQNVHSDHHSLWINDKRKGHLINGNDGGINISYDDGENWIKCNAPSVGQFYYINVDLQEPYNVYGGLQDNGVWKGPSTYEASVRWHSSGKYPYEGLLGGDGMQVQIDSRDQTVYTGFQFGNYYRIDPDRNRTSIKPKHELGERPFRWNWQTPVLISKHNEDVIYIGSNFLHRSMNKGEKFEKISGDLTRGGKKGDVPYGSLSTIDESSFRFGLLYTGSDDGLIHVSKDAGYSWINISKSLPQNMWVSRVFASNHSESRVFASLNGYRWDDFTPYLYTSDDFGETWKRIGNDLPMEAINVVKEDPKDENILYVGTDHGVYVSFDRGESFTIMADQLPAVAVHDLVVHPKANDLLVGTHGRSIYKANIEHLQQLNQVRDQIVHLFALNSIRKSTRWGNQRNIYSQNTSPNYEFGIYAQKAGSYDLDILDEEGNLLNTIKLEADPGISYHTYDMTIGQKIAENLTKKGNTMIKASENGKYYLNKGKYTMLIKGFNGESKQEFEIK